MHVKVTTQTQTLVTIYCETALRLEQFWITLNGRTQLQSNRGAKYRHSAVSNRTNTVIIL